MSIPRHRRYRDVYTAEGSELLGIRGVYAEIPGDPGIQSVLIKLPGDPGRCDAAVRRHLATTIERKAISSHIASTLTLRTELLGRFD